MRFFQSRLGVPAILLGLVLIAVLAQNAISVDRATRPKRDQPTLLDFESMGIRVVEVEFNATDEVSLSGWSMEGQPAMPSVILCHDLGSNKLGLVNLAIDLQRAGFSVFLFDFRGHGASSGRRSSLGLLEKRDVLGAIDWASRNAELGARLGVYGAGMGAHAAVLAAAERRDLKVLVLDGLIPDAAFTLGRETYPRAAWARKYLRFLSNGFYFMFAGTSPSSERAADAVQRLGGRDLLMLAPATDTVLAEEMRAMVATIPDHVDGDGNLVVLPATLGEGLYGEQLSRYHERVTGFFVDRLPRGEALAAGW